MSAPSAYVNAPVIVESPARHILHQHFVVPEEEIPATIRESFAALYRRISEAGGMPVGAPFAMYNTDCSPWDMDVCVPIDQPITPSPGFRYMELPAARVVSLLHVGPYHLLERAYDAAEWFIRDNGLQMAGSPREIYLSPPATPPDEIQTVLEWPIAVTVDGAQAGAPGRAEVVRHI